jgi:DNA-binding transcriptional ArsR family regulator
MQLVFEALASPVRRKILAYLANAELNAGDIAARFDMTKPSISQHLSLLEAAGLIASERRGKFIYYRQNRENVAATLASLAQEVCPVGRPLKRESARLAEARVRKKKS